MIAGRVTAAPSRIRSRLCGVPKWSYADLTIPSTSLRARSSGRPAGR
jgi:hypothetical protein